MAQVYLSQFSRRAGVADSASYVIGGGTPSPADTYIQYNKEDKFGAEVYFRYIYPIHSFQHGYNTNAVGYWSHAEGSTTYTGFNNTFSSSILSGAVTLSAEYGNITSSFTTGDYIYLNDYESDNIFSTAVAKITNTSWDDTSSYVTLDVNNIHATTSFVGSLGTYYIQNLLGNKIARAYIAHSEGEGTYAMGVGAHSEGSGSYAIGKYSHVEGNNTVALGDYQTVVGQYNLFSTSQSAFIIGDGYAKIIDSGTFANSPTSGSFSFNITSTYSPLTDLTGSIITVVSASSSISETFIIDDVNDLGGGEYEVIVNRGITQDYYEDDDTFSILKITRHNLLFASQSYFQISASNVFLQGIPSSSTAPQVLIYDDETGQVYYTSSAAFGGVGSSPNGPDTSIQYNNNGNFNGIESFTLTSLHGGGTSVVRLTGSMLVSGSITSTGVAPNNVGFVGTASWAQSASNALQAVSASYAPNFANTDLTFTDNRDHHTNGYSYFIYSNLEGMAVSGGYQYFDNDSNSIGVAQGSTDTYTYIEIFTSSIDLSFNADPASPSAYIFTSTSASFSSSLNVTNSVFFPGLISASQPHLIVIDTASGKLFYLNSSSFGGSTFSGTNTRVVFYSGSTAISGSPNFTFNYTLPHLQITGSTTLSGSTFIPGINNTAQQNVVTIDPTTGQLFYTSSNKLSAVSTPLDIQDDGILVKSSPTFINFSGSGVSASSNGTGVNVFIPGGGGTGTPGGSNTQIQFNGNGGFSGSANFTFISSSRIVNLTGSLNISGSTTLTGSIFVSGAISSSLGPNTVGFFGTASWAQSASNATSASYASTASAAPSDTFIQYNKEGLFGATGSFRFIYTSQSLQHGNSPVALGIFSHAEGDRVTASGNYSHAEGTTTKALNISSHAEGFNTIAFGIYSHAEGISTVASGAYSHAEGLSTIAIGSNSHAEGQANTASGDYSHAEGLNNKALNLGSHTEGRDNIASGSYSHTEGRQNSSSGDYSHAEGWITNAVGQYSHAEGWSTSASGDYSHAEGYQTTSSGNYSHAEGSGTKTTDIGAHAEGTNTIASNQFAHAEGNRTVASGQYSHAEGYLSSASNTGAHAEGYQTIALGAFSHTEGQFNLTLNSYSHAEGNLTTASGDYSHAEGYLSVTLNSYSHAEGRQTKAIGYASHAEGYYTSASGDYSHAEGRETTASGDFSHTEGYRTSASGEYSHAEGTNTIAIGYASHAEGVQTTSTGNNSHAEGNTSKAIGYYSHAEGTTNIAFGEASHAEGINTTASGNWSHAEGINTLAGYTGYFGRLIVTPNKVIEIYNEGDLTSVFTSNQLIIGTNGIFNYLSTNYIAPTFSIQMDSDFNTSGTSVIADISSLYDPSRTGNGGNYSHAEGTNNEAIGWYSHAEGTNTIAAGNSSHAEGYYSIASKQYSHAEGFKTVTTGQYSHAEGSGSLASGIASHAEGRTTTASGDYSHTEGWNTSASGQYSHAEGWRSIASGSYSHAEGSGSLAQGLASYTAGNQTIALGTYQNVIGQFNVSSLSQSAFIIGDGINNSNRRNVLFVSRSHFEVSASRTFLQGLSDTSQQNVLTYNPTTGQVYYTASSNLSAVSIPLNIRDESISVLSNPTFINFTGSGVSASVSSTGVNVFIPGGSAGSGDITDVIGGAGITVDNSGGPQPTASLDTSSAHFTKGVSQLTGSLLTTSSFNSWTGSNTSQFAGTSSYATFASAAYAFPLDTYIQYNSGGLFHATSSFRFIYTSQSLQQGFNTTASGQYSHAEGGSTTYNLGTLASGIGSHAEGILTTAAGEGSHAEGYGSATAPGALSAHAEGGSTLASGWVSHAEGSGTHAESYGSHAEGNQTTSSGWYSHTEGYLTRTIDPPSQPQSSYAHAEGEMTLASGRASHVEGYYNTASGDYQLVIGQYNVSLPSQSSFIIGDGTNDNNRHNVLFVSRSHFEVSASNTYLQGLSDVAQSYVLTYNQSTGQVHYTASSNIGGGGSGVTINNNTNNNLITATGTSNTLDGEANLTFDGSSLKVIGNVTASSFTGSFTGSLLGTASYADTASAVNVTVSSNADDFLPIIVAYTGSSDGAKLAYIDNGFQYNPSTNILYLASAGALVAGNTTIQSVTATFGSANSQDNIVRITGSLNVTKSLNVVGSMSLNVIPTASFHISGTTILNGGNLVGLPFSSFTTIPTQITGNTGIRGFLYVYPRSGDTSSIVFGGGGYQSWALRSLGFNDFQIRSVSNENATPGPQVTLMHFSSGSNGEFKIGVLNETPEYTFDISGSARVTSSFYLPGLTTAPQSNVLTINTSTGQVYYTASSAFASIDSNIFKGTQTFSGSLIPAGPYIDNTSSYDLGSPTTAWNKIYVSNNSLHFVSGSTSSSIGFNNGVISFNNATVTIPTGSTIPYTSTSSIIGNGLSSSFNINHGFNTRNLHITVYESSSNGETVYPDIRRINENTASIIFANPPSVDQYVVYISQ